MQTTLDLTMFRLRALIATQAEAYQTKAQGVISKKAIEVPSADDEQKEKYKVRKESIARALWPAVAANRSRRYSR